MGTDTEETTLVACPNCGKITLEHQTTAHPSWRVFTRYSCVAEDCGYQHTIEHP